MRMSEILRTIADAMDAEQPNVDMAEPQQGMHDQDSDDGTSIMVPPLQAKLELLKKSVGMDNAYGDYEIDALKRNAGITVAKIESSEDNDMLG